MWTWALRNAADCPWLISAPPSLRAVHSSCVLQTCPELRNLCNSTKIWGSIFQRCLQHRARSPHGLIPISRAFGKISIQRSFTLSAVREFMHSERDLNRQLQRIQKMVSCFCLSRGYYLNHQCAYTGQRGQADQHIRWFQRSHHFFYVSDLCMVCAFVFWRAPRCGVTLSWPGLMELVLNQVLGTK